MTNNPQTDERRERYAVAIHDAMEPDLSLVDQEPACQALFARAAEAAAALADTELAARRAAVLTDAERTMLTYALDQAQERIWSEGGFTEEDQAAVNSLRRLASEAPQQEPDEARLAAGFVNPQTGTGYATGGNWHPPETDADPAEAHRLALSEALGLGTGAPWDAIRDRATELAGAWQQPDTEALAAALDGLDTLIATSSRDWGEYRVDAWLWAVLCGWDCEQDEHDDTCTHGAMEEMAERHGWDADTVAKARRYRAAVRALTAPQSP